MTNPPAAKSPDAPHGGYGDAAHADAYVYETSGIAEGHASVPKWLIAVILALFAFWVGYVATQWNAQSSSAQPKK
jgi:hypothetical protein